MISFVKSFFKSKKKNLSPNNDWFISNALENEAPAIIRGRENLTDFMNSKEYEERVEVIWNTKNSTDKGFSTPEENELMQQVEDSLVDIMEVDFQAVLTIVYTDKHKRSWIFYTKELSEFMNRLNSALSEFELLPLSISNSSDSNWEMYKEFKLVYK
jgi:hypothetical protein